MIIIIKTHKKLCTFPRSTVPRAKDPRDRPAYFSPWSQRGGCAPTKGCSAPANSHGACGVCVCVFVYTCTAEYTHTHTHIHTHLRQRYTHTHTDTYTHTHLRQR